MQPLGILYEDLEPLKDSLHTEAPHKTREIETYLDAKIQEDKNTI